MVKRNKNLAKLKTGYLFPEINRRKKKVQEKNPSAKIISLGIGDTTEPLGEHIDQGLLNGARGLADRETYSGYGEEPGSPALRAKIAEVLYKGIVKPDEVFVSDGAKCDIGRLQVMFGPDATVAIQDPSYPVYVDGSVIIGATGGFGDASGQFEGISYMRCLPKNNFFPGLDGFPRTDLIYFCSPNNPTGAVADKKQLALLIGLARKNKSIIIFDAAYAEFICDADLPRSIFEIDGAREVAVEVNSFSKSIGFTGVRLGWTVVPQDLKFEDGAPVINDWTRIMTTVFNGASNIVQQGGLAALDDQGLKEMDENIRFVMDNAKIIKNTLEEMGIKTYGGTNAPYVWAEFPGRSSWDVFEEILNGCHVVTTPGSGFGPAGEGFVRFSAFGHRHDIEEAVARLQKNFFQ